MTRERGAFLKNSTEIGAPISEILMMILSALPRRLSAEITRVCSSRRDFPIGLSEIRVRTRGSSSLVISGENVRLFSRAKIILKEDLTCPIRH